MTVITETVTGILGETTEAMEVTMVEIEVMLMVRCQPITISRDSKAVGLRACLMGARAIRILITLREQDSSIQQGVSMGVVMA